VRTAVPYFDLYSSYSITERKRQEDIGD